MADSARERLKQWLASGEARLAPLSFPQRELWEATPVPIEDPAHHICCLIEVGGRLTRPECEAAIRRVVERHEVLRLSFLPGKDGPLQMIRRGGEPSFRWPDEDEPPTLQEEVEEKAREIFLRPFDLVLGPLYRVEALRLAPDKFVLVFAIHHAIADGWTLGVFVQDLVVGYLQERRGRTAPPPAVPLTYSSWAAEERAIWSAAELEQRARFWREQLAGCPPLWPVPTERHKGPLHRWVAELAPEQTVAARELARRANATLFTTLLALFRLAFSRWHGAADFVVGTPVANRHKPAARETMGYFAGVVPLRHRVDEEATILENVRAAHEGTMDCFASAIPFVEIARLFPAAMPGANPVFDVRFALQNHPVPDVSMSGLSTRLRMRSTGTARFRLGCEITEQGDQLEVVWLYHPALLTRGDVQELQRVYQTLLIHACAAPEKPAAAILS